MHILWFLKAHCSIFRNTGYLSIIELFRFLIPFVALPYLIKVVGPEKYGTVVFVQTIVSYFSYFINFGIDVSAIRDVSTNRECSQKLSEIVCSIIGVKFCLLLASILFYILIICLLPMGRQHTLLFWGAFLTCFSDVLLPIWFFQGVEKMKYLTFVQSISILLYIIFIVLFIKIPDHYERIALIQSLCNLFAGFLSICIMFHVFKLRILRVKLNAMLDVVKRSFPFFLSRISNFFNISISKLICGSFFSMNLVAAYDLMLKIDAGMSIPMTMINQAVYPHIAKTKDRLFATKFLLVIVIVSLCMSLFMFISAPLANAIFAGGSLPESVTLIRIASISVFFAGIDVYLGAPVLVSFGFSKIFNRSVYFATICLLITYFILFTMGILTYTSFVIAFVIAEIATTFCRWYSCRKNKLIDFSLLR